MHPRANVLPVNAHRHALNKIGFATHNARAHIYAQRVQAAHAHVGNQIEIAALPFDIGGEKNAENVPLMHRERHDNGCCRAVTKAPRAHKRQPHASNYSSALEDSL